MKKYFRLNPYCYLVQGTNGGCIYNLSTGDMISLTGRLYNALIECEKNTPLSSISDCNYDAIDKLYNQNIGIYYNNPIFVDKLYLGFPRYLSYLGNKHYIINSLYIELTNICNFNCVFCPQYDDSVYRMTGCKRWKSKKPIEDILVWKKIIQQVSRLSCKQLVFIGGEPFLNINLLREIVQYAVTYNINNFLIFTNGSLLDIDVINFLKKYNIKLQIQILANTDKLYDEITGCHNINSIISKNLSLLINNDINFDLRILVNSFNENEIENIYYYYNKLLNNKNIKLDFIYPVDQNKFYSKKYISLMYNKKSFFKRVDINNFCHSNKLHNCYGNMLAIAVDGDVFPCIMSRNLLLGNIVKNDVINILKNSQYDYYCQFTKDKVHGCQQCQFRYGCFDCRAIEMYATNKLEGMEYCDIKPV